MASGGSHPLTFPADPGDNGLPNQRDGIFTGRSFPAWGDENGDYGNLHVLRLQAEEGDLPKNPVLIRKSVEAHLGLKIREAYPEKRGVTYIIKLRNEKHVERLKRMSKLSDGHAIKIIEHPTLNQTRCVINCPETIAYKTEAILEELKDQGVTSIRRIERREGSDFVPTPTIILTIGSTVAPSEVDFGWIRCRTRPYYPTPMLCYGCFEYGHPRKRCNTEPICGICCGKHQSTHENPCRLEPYCKHCKSNSHPVMNKKCPVYMKEVDIQHIMVNKGMGYPGARRIWESEHRATTAASVVNASNEARFADLNAKFDMLLKETGKKDQQLEFLKKEGEKRNQQMLQLFATIQAKDKEIAKRDERIASLEAALAAAYVPIPSLETTANVEEPMLTEMPTPTGAIKKTSTIKKDSLSSHHSRNRSRSPQKPLEGSGKDGRSHSTPSRNLRHPEPKPKPNPNNGQSGIHKKEKAKNPGTPKPTGRDQKQDLSQKSSTETSPKRKKQNKQKPETANDEDTITISDNEIPPSQQTNPEMDISSDEPELEPEEEEKP